jgi:hypothetical protein
MGGFERSNQARAVALRIGGKAFDNEQEKRRTGASVKPLSLRIGAEAAPRQRSESTGAAEPRRSPRGPYMPRCSSAVSGQRLSGSTLRRIATVLSPTGWVKCKADEYFAFANQPVWCY